MIRKTTIWKIKGNNFLRNSIKMELRPLFLSMLFCYYGGDTLPITKNRQHWKFPIVDLELTRLAYERNIVPDFEYIMVDSHVPHKWADLPNTQSGPRIWTFGEMEEHCGPSLTLPLLKFGYDPAILCFRKDELSKDQFLSVISSS